MSSAELVERLCALLRDAVAIVQEQSELLAMHGIVADDLDERCEQLISETEQTM